MITKAVKNFVNSSLPCCLQSTWYSNILLHNMAHSWHFQRIFFAELGEFPTSPTNVYTEVWLTLKFHFHSKSCFFIHINTLNPQSLTVTKFQSFKFSLGPFLQKHFNHENYHTCYGWKPAKAHWGTGAKLAKSTRGLSHWLLHVGAAKSQITASYLWTISVTSVKPTNTESLLTHLHCPH